MLMKPVTGAYGYWVNDAGEFREVKPRSVWASWPVVELQDHDGKLWLENPQRNMRLLASVLVWETFQGMVPFGQSVYHRDGNYRNLAIENLVVQSGGE